jgi:hypothetical protein
VLKTAIISIGKILMALPGAVAAVYGLTQASEKFGFDKSNPDLHQNLLQCGKTLLALLVGYWEGYILLCVFLGTLWAIVVAEPKHISKREFRRRISNRSGRH